MRDHDQELQQRLRQLIRFLLPTIFGFGILFVAIGLYLQDWATLITAGFVLTHGICIAISRSILQRGRRELAAYWIGYGAFVSTLGMSVALPALAPGWAVVPFLIAAVLLQFAASKDMQIYLTACACVSVTIMLIGSTLPTTTVIPNSWLLIVRISTFIAIVFVALWMLGQFSSSLQAALQNLQESHQRLQDQQIALSEANQLLNSQLDEERNLLELVTTLEVPIIPVADHVVLAPIIGHLDARRIEQVRQRLLNSATQRMHTVILDLSGMTTLSEKIVRDLIQIVQALRLQGVSVLVCGISADLALPLSNFGTQLQGIQVVGTVQEAIQTATLLTRQVNLRAS